LALTDDATSITKVCPIKHKSPNSFHATVEVDEDNIYEATKDIQEDEAFFPWTKEDDELLMRYSLPGKDVPTGQDFGNVFKDIPKDDISSNDEDPGEDKEPGEFDDLPTPDDLRPSKKLNIPEGFQPRSKTRNGGRNFRPTNNIIIIYDINTFLITVGNKFDIKT